MCWVTTMHLTVMKLLILAYVTHEMLVINSRKKCTELWSIKTRITLSAVNELQDFSFQECHVIWYGIRGIKEADDKESSFSVCWCVWWRSLQPGHRLEVTRITEGKTSHQLQHLLAWFTEHQFSVPALHVTQMLFTWNTAVLMCGEGDWWLSHTNAGSCNSSILSTTWNNSISWLHMPHSH